MGCIITLARQFGSGGRELGRRLAEELHIEYYDKQIVSQIAEHTSLAEGYVRSVIDQQPHSLMPITVGRSFVSVDNYAFRQAHSVYQAQSEILREMAGKSDCVIIGRCADYILRDMNPLRLFVYADLDSRVNRCLQHRTEDEKGMTDKQLARKICKLDKNRAKYYEFYTGRKWGARENYDLCINTTNADIKNLVPALARMLG